MAGSSGSVLCLIDRWQTVAEEACVRAIPITAITFACLFLSSIVARADGPWCANYGTGPGMNCGFYSFQQCQATISGNGGFCQQNGAAATYGYARQPQRRYQRGR